MADAEIIVLFFFNLYPTSPKDASLLLLKCPSHIADGQQLNFE